MHSNRNSDRNHNNKLHRPWLPLARVCVAGLSSLLLLARPIVAWTSGSPRGICESSSSRTWSLASSSSCAGILPICGKIHGVPGRRAMALGFSTASTFDDDNDDDDDDNDDDDREEEDAWYENLDVLLESENDAYGGDAEDDWIPDAEKAKGRRPRNSRELIPANEVLGDSYNDNNSNKPRANRRDDGFPKKERPSPYTEEEEELIAAMGGKEKPKPNRQSQSQNETGAASSSSQREIGFLGDSTLREIARDYSVPICYLADVLTVWGVPVPINVNDRLGDLVTGEQAFALVEAVNTLDVGYLNDRYSNQNLLQVCDGWEIDIGDAFGFAMREGWSLPFGVRTNLRVEQEDELLRVFSTLYREVDDD